MTIRFNEITEPATPPAGKVWLYVDSADSKVKSKDDTGTVTIFEPGTDGKTILNGVVNPTTEGVNGDFYLNTAANTFFGPKAAGVWPAGFSIIGPTGATGPTGPAGPGSAGAEGDGSYFFTSTASDLGGGRYVMAKGVPAGGGFGISQTGVLNGDILATFVTVSGDPNVTYLPSGVLSFYAMARKDAGTKVAKLYAEFYTRTALAVETLIGTSPVTVALTGVNALVDGQIAMPVVAGLLTTTRLLVKIKAEVTGAGTDPDISVDIQGATYSRARIPFEPVASVNGLTGAVVLTPTDIGLGNVDNTSDLNKPISTDTQNALNLKADLLGTANRVAVYDASGELGAKANWQINADDGIDLNQAVVPVAGNAYKKLNNYYSTFTPSADSEENWYQLWLEPNIPASAFEMGDPTTGLGGLSGLGMASTALGDFGYIRNFDFSITVGNGTDPVAGNTVSAMNQYFNIQNNTTVENMYGFPITMGGLGTVNQATGYSLNTNFADLTQGLIGFNCGGNAVFGGVGSFVNGFNFNPSSYTGVENATGIFINMSNVTAINTPLAGNFVGNVFIDGDLTVTGAFNFSGDLSVGSLQSFKALNVIDGGGNPTTNNAFVTQLTGAGTVANCDTIGVSTPSLITLGATFAGTSGGFGLGLAAQALPNVIAMAAGCSLDNLTACAYVNLFDAANTGGTIGRLINVRAVNIPQGGTQTITRAYSFFADFFAGDIATDSWGLYDNGAKYNWIANKLKIGGTDTTAYNFEVDGSVLLDGNLGFYGTTPIAQPASSGAVSAGVVYTATEQTMLNEVYSAIRNLGLMA